MKKLLFVFLLMSVSSTVFADHIKYSPGTAVTISNATVTLVADGNGDLQVTNIAGSNVAPVPDIDPDVVPEPPVGLLDTMTKATVAVPEYAQKDNDAKSIAFSIGFVTPYLKGNAKTSDITAILKTMSDASMGANSNKWSGWWSTLDNATKNQTVEQYKVSLGVVKTALTADSAFASSEFMGEESYGLDPTKLMKLLEFILKYLPMIMALFA